MTLAIHIHTIHSAQSLFEYAHYSLTCNVLASEGHLFHFVLHGERGLAAPTPSFVSAYSSYRRLLLLLLTLLT